MLGEQLSGFEVATDVGQDLGAVEIDFADLLVAGQAGAGLLGALLVQSGTLLLERPNALLDLP